MEKKRKGMDREVQPKVKVALCQVETKEWAVESNFKNTLDAIAEAGNSGADIAITPECVFHGYAGGKPKEELQKKVREIAEPLDGDKLAQIKALAKDKGLHVVVGFAELGGGDVVHNTAAVISSDGELLEAYRKVHCRRFEDVLYSGAFTAGTEFKSHELGCAQGSFKLGTLICFDREIPESVRCLRALGSELIACPLATHTFDLGKYPKEADNELLTRARAAENEVVIVVVNHAGRFNGGSMMIGPMGEVITQLDAKPQVKVVEAPIGWVRQKQEVGCGWAGWGFRRPEVYSGYLG